MVRRAGLDVSAIKVSELINRRIDAECYRIEFLQLDTWQDFYSLKDLCLIRSGTTPPDRDDELKDGVILLKTTDIRNNVLSREDSSNFYYISKEISERMTNTLLQPKDVLINIVGATTDVIGRVAYVPEGFSESNITQAMAFLRVTDPRLNPAFLFSFLSSEYGNKQVRRYARPTGQYNLNLQEVSNFKVPLPPKDFQRKIEKLVITADVKLGESKQLYADAEKLLTSELGLDKLDLNSGLCSVQNLSDVQKSKRIDAEYYQPRYSILLSLIKNYSLYVKTIKDFRSFNSRGSQPVYVESGGLNVINSKHILEQHLDYDNFEQTNEENWESKKEARIFKDDILIYTTGANVGRTNIYLHSDKALASNHVNILRLQSENPIYVGFVINSLVGRLQTRQLVTGSAQVELYSSDIDRFVIPFIEVELQKKISRLVIQSYEARQEAKRLLGEAKSEVERLIEGK